MMSAVVACSRNRVIGSGGALPWQLPEDLRRFRLLTAGGTVVMGRRTYESLPEAFRPLPNRRNVVISGDPRYRADGAEVVASPAAALEAANGECFVIGGGQVYAALLPVVHRVYLTEVDVVCDGDTYFPVLDERSWHCVSEVGPVADNGYEVVFRTYERR